MSIAGILGRKLRGGEVIELVGDLGSGKTAFVRGLAIGIDSKDQVQSPSFTISRIYRGKNIEIHHFDFHRLDEPGIMKAELAESLSNLKVVSVIEWSDIVKDMLPADRLQVKIEADGETERQLSFKAGSKHQHLLKGLK